MRNKEIWLPTAEGWGRDLLVVMDRIYLLNAIVYIYIYPSMKKCDLHDKLLFNQVCFKYE